MTGLKLPEGTQLDVTLRWDADDQQQVGRLAMHDGRALFEYATAFLGSGVEVSPVTMRTRSGVIAPARVIGEFEGLHGVFNDSLPDGWGRLLVDREAARRGTSPSTLTPLDRLAIVGASGIGALVYRPAQVLGPLEGLVDLDATATAIAEVFAGSADEFLQLLITGGSPQGARPKAMVVLMPDGSLRHDTDVPPPGGEHWLVKFASREDPDDIGAIEYAYAQMARAAGLEVPQTRLIGGKLGPYFAVRRFDRDGTRRTHVATACGLAEASHRAGSMTYAGLIRLALHVAQDFAAGMQMFRRMAFNVLAHNRDDHTKQFSFCMTRNGTWQLAPAYDLTFSDGTRGEHATLVANAGKSPGRNDMLEVARAGGIDTAEAGVVLEQVAEAVARWRAFAADAGLSRATSSRIAGSIAPASAASRSR
jgi:serine/threonine-protein kinase HipA